MARMLRQLVAAAHPTEAISRDALEHVIPRATTEHNDIPRLLLIELALQLPRNQFRVTEAGKLRTSSGDYDVDAKLPEYRWRGDAEIWRIHPLERSLILWRRQQDCSYVEFHHPGGPIRIASLPGVVVNVDELLL